MRLKSTGLAALVLIIAAVPAGAPAFAQQPGMVIAFLDKNADGKCDLNEYLTFQQPRLAQFDKDGDSASMIINVVSGKRAATSLIAWRIKKPTANTTS